MTAPKKTIPRLLWLALLMLMAATSVAGYFLPRHSYFVFDSEPLFYAALGFALPFFVVVIARITGFILKRPEDYWEKHGENPLSRKEDV